MRAPTRGHAWTLGALTALFAGRGSVKLEGLESPVMVRQADDRNVEQFLNYSFSITTEK